MRTRILLVDGVTGAGKSTVIARLRELLPGVSIIPEEETLGDLMDLIQDPAWRAHPRFEALERIMTRLERGNETFIVERFHSTAFALFPEWRLLAPFDERLARLGAVQVLLTYRDVLAEERAIERPDRRDVSWANGMDQHYGSRAAAIDAVVRSNAKRVEQLSLSRLPFLHLDTSEGQWMQYARTIVAFWS